MSSTKANKKFDVYKSDSNDNKVREFAKKKRFTYHDLINIQPMNERQEQFFDYYNNGYDLIIESGSAGAGKSFCALYAAAGEVFTDKKDKIVIVRSNQTVRKEGFLPGTLEEKQEPFEAPYRSIFNDIIGTYSGDSYENAKALGKLEFVTTTYLRGMTYDNAVIIVDEVQNLDYEEIMTVLTRVGANSRIVLIGDEKQDDIKRTKQKSGFSKIKEVLKRGYPDYKEVQYKIEDATARSELVAKVLKADYYYGHIE